jgi:hypothetical protein
VPKTEVLYDPERHGALLTPEAAVTYLKETHAVQLNPQRLSELRAFPGGPRFIKPTQQSVRYPAALLDEWAAARNRKPILDCIPLKASPPVTHAEVMRKIEDRRQREGASARGDKPVSKHSSSGGVNAQG